MVGRVEVRRLNELRCECLVGWGGESVVFAMSLLQLRRILYTTVFVCAGYTMGVKVYGE
jgi:hypothetical protein